MPTSTEQLAKNLGEAPTSKYDILEEVRGFFSSAITDSTAEALPVVEEVGGVTVEAFVLGVVGAIDLPFLVVALLIVGSLGLMYYIIRHWAGNLRFIGGVAGPVLDHLFAFIPTLINAVVSHVQQAVHDCINGLLSAFTFLLGVTLPRVQPAHSTPVPNHTGYATEAEIQKINNQIHAINAQLAYLAITLDPLATPSPVPIPPTNIPLNPPQAQTVIRIGVPQTVWDQIHHLEAQAHAHQTSITDLYSRTDRLNNIATQLQSEFKNLTGEIHAVRAVSASWQDIEQQLENLGGLTTQFIDETAAELGTLTAHQTQLLPLTLLLEPGIRGLRNLRKLEDNICQCPKFANIPNELGTALAVLEFVENG